MKALLVLMLVSSAALADDGALLRCRQVKDVPTRVACYDAIPIGASGASGTGTVAVPAMAAAVNPAVAAVPVAPAPVPAAPTRAQLEQSFGKETVAVPAAVAASTRVDAISSSIAGHFDGWGPNQRIRLANGQVWRVIDGSNATLDLDNPAVTLKRSFSGAVFLNIAGTNNSPKVLRVE